MVARQRSLSMDSACLWLVQSILTVSAVVAADQKCCSGGVTGHPTFHSAPSSYTTTVSMPFDCSRLAQSISVEFHRGGTEPEVVFQSGSRCCRRVFQVALDHPRLAQSSQTSSTAPEYYFRFAAATLDLRVTRLAEGPRVPISRGTPLANREPRRNRWRTR